MAETAAGRPGSIDELRADAADVLRDVRAWRLTRARWGPVAAAVEGIARAERAGDVDAFRAAVVELEMLGPVRSLGFGEEPMVEPPEQVVELAEALVYTLDGEPPAPPEY